jgi:acetyltransferase-like isoleucine patch superfamily enzyme
MNLIPASADTKRSNPFSVKAPYVKTPVYIDYGMNLQIAASTFINRNLTVIDSPATRIIIGERCMIGPNVTLAGVGHPLGKCAIYLFGYKLQR